MADVFSELCVTAVSGHELLVYESLKPLKVLLCEKRVIDFSASQPRRFVASYKLRDMYVRAERRTGKRSR